MISLRNLHAPIKRKNGASGGLELSFVINTYNLDGMKVEASKSDPYLASFLTTYEQVDKTFLKSYPECLSLEKMLFQGKQVETTSSCDGGEGRGNETSQSSSMSYGEFQRRYNLSTAETFAAPTPRFYNCPWCNHELRSLANLKKHKTKCPSLQKKTNTQCVMRRVKSIIQKSKQLPSLNVVNSKSSLRIKPGLQLKIRRNFQARLKQNFLKLKPSPPARLKREPLPRNHVCTKCSEAFVSAQTLDMHMHFDHRPRPTCHICHKMFECRRKLSDHVTQCTGKNDNLIKQNLGVVDILAPSKIFTCNKCENYFCNQHMLREHKLIVNKRTPISVEVTFVTPISGDEQSAQQQEPPPSSPTEKFDFKVCIKNEPHVSLAAKKDSAATAKIDDGDNVCPYCEKEFQNSRRFSQHSVFCHAKMDTLHSSCRTLKGNHHQSATQEDMCTFLGKGKSQRNRLEGTLSSAPLCCVCKKNFRTDSDLLKHIRSVHKRKHYRISLKCRHCAKPFDRLRAYCKHLELHARPNKCPVCNFRHFKTAKLLKFHIQVLHRRSYCTKCHAHYGLQQRHKCSKSHTTTTESKEKCEQMHPFTLRRFLINKWYSSAHGTFACYVCAEPFAHVPDLAMHLVGEHSHAHPFPCRHCTRSFKRPNQLVGHHKQEHDDEMDYLGDSISMQRLWSKHSIVECAHQGCEERLFVGEDHLKYHHFEKHKKHDAPAPTQLQSSTHEDRDAPSATQLQSSTHENRDTPSTTQPEQSASHDYDGDEIVSAKFVFTAEEVTPLHTHLSPPSGILSSSLRHYGIDSSLESYGHQSQSSIYVNIADELPMQTMQTTTTTSGNDSNQLDDDAHISNIHLFDCRYCSKRFHQEASLSKHLTFCKMAKQCRGSTASNHQRKGWNLADPSDICRRATATAIQLPTTYVKWKHRRTLDDYYSCEHCSKRFQSKRKLEGHRNICKTLYRTSSILTDDKHRVETHSRSSTISSDGSSFDSDENPIIRPAGPSLDTILSPDNKFNEKIVPENEVITLQEVQESLIPLDLSDEFSPVFSPADVKEGSDGFTPILSPTDVKEVSDGVTPVLSPTDVRKVSVEVTDVMVNYPHLCQQFNGPKRQKMRLTSTSTENENHGGHGSAYNENGRRLDRRIRSKSTSTESENRQGADRKIRLGSDDDGNGKRTDRKIRLGSDDSENLKKVDLEVRSISTSTGATNHNGLDCKVRSRSISTESEHHNRPNRKMHSGSDDSEHHKRADRKIRSRSTSTEGGNRNGLDRKKHLRATPAKTDSVHRHNNKFTSTKRDDHSVYRKKIERPSMAVESTRSDASTSRERHCDSTQRTEQQQQRRERRKREQRKRNKQNFMSNRTTAETNLQKSNNSAVSNIVNVGVPLKTSSSAVSNIVNDGVPLKTSSSAVSNIVNDGVPLKTSSFAVSNIGNDGIPRNSNNSAISNTRSFCSPSLDTVEVFTCRICSINFDTEHSLAIHVQAAHTEGTTFSADHVPLQPGHVTRPPLCLPPEQLARHKNEKRVTNTRLESPSVTTIHHPLSPKQPPLFIDLSEQLFTCNISYAHERTKASRKRKQSYPLQLEKAKKTMQQQHPTAKSKHLQDIVQDLRRKKRHSQERRNHSEATGTHLGQPNYVKNNAHTFLSCRTGKQPNDSNTVVTNGIIQQSLTVVEELPKNFIIDRGLSNQPRFLPLQDMFASNNNNNSTISQLDKTLYEPLPMPPIPVNPTFFTTPKWDRSAFDVWDVY